MLHRFEIIRKQAHLLYAKHMSIDILFKYCRYVFGKVDKKNVDLLYDRFIWSFFYRYRDFRFSKKDLDTFMEIYYSWKIEGKFQRDPSINKLCTDINYLVKVLNNGNIKEFV